MARSLQKMILSFRDFKLKWCFKVPKKPIFYEIKAFLHVEYSKEEKKIDSKIVCFVLECKNSPKKQWFLPYISFPQKPTGITLQGIM